MTCPETVMLVLQTVLSSNLQLVAVGGGSEFEVTYNKMAICRNLHEHLEETTQITYWSFRTQLKYAHLQKPCAHWAQAGQENRVEIYTSIDKS